MVMKVLFRPIVFLCEVYKKIPFMSNHPNQVVSLSKVIRKNSHARSALAVAKRRASAKNKAPF